MVKSRLVIGDWTVERTANCLSGPDGAVDLEPRVMDLLMMLADRAGEVISKEDIMESLWGSIYVNEDALTRSMFKLRKALGDDARNPTYVATVSKRGYRLIAEVVSVNDSATDRAKFIARRRGIIVGVPVLLFVALLGWIGFSLISSSSPGEDTENVKLFRADGFYSQYTRKDNEAALRLYEAILDEEPMNAAALAGLSNALTQKVIRYEDHGSGEAARGSLTEALASDWLETDSARSTLQRAEELARQASDLNSAHGRAWRALGLVLSAQHDFIEAERAYERALVIDPDDWGTMINLSELYELTDRAAKATPYLEQAWFAMERRFEGEPISIRPWHSAVGLSVAKVKYDAGEYENSRLWYRRVLARDPLNADAVRGLSRTLKRLGDETAAEAICKDLFSASQELC